VNLIIGIVVLLGCVLGGFVIHGGKLMAIWQPSEVLIIGGAALGGFIISNPMRVVKQTLAGVPTLLKGPKYSKEHYLALFSLMYELFNIARKEGVMGLEREIENPETSAVFSKQPLIVHDHHAVEFICDYLRLIVSGDMNPFQIENLMDVELGTHHHEAEAPAHAMSKVSDALPGFGIVAAVLGIVNTMGALGGPVEEIGEKVAAALVGTFMGIFLAYGIIGPMSTALEQRAKDEGAFFTTVKTCIIAMLQGYPPQIAVEFGRKATSSTLRPTFQELEGQLRNKPAAV
jgi:chemotaxis protein MotA